MDKKNNKRYCVKCGKELQKIRIPAEKAGFIYNEVNDGVRTLPAFNPETGERQYATRYKCPMIKWYNIISDHSDYTEKER